MPLSNRLAAEFLGTFWLVLGGCGSAVLAAAFPDVGIGLARRVAGLRPDRADDGLRDRPHLRLPPQPGGVGRPVVGGRFPAASCCPTSSRRCWARSPAAAVLYLIASGKAGFDLCSAASPSNGYGEHSPGGYSLTAGAGDRGRDDVLLPARSSSARPTSARRAGFAPIAIGLGLTLIHLISIPVTNTSVNPARSTGPALFVGGWALAQLWLFWVAPMLGGAAAGVVYRMVSGDRSKAAGVEGPASASALPKSPG